MSTDVEQPASHPSAGAEDAMPATGHALQELATVTPVLVSTSTKAGLDRYNHRPPA